MTRTAAPPSVICDEFPAVTVPNRRSKYGLSFPSASIVWLSRTPLSFVEASENFGGIGTGTISSASFARERVTRWCERSEKASCSSRVMPCSLARTSAVSPMLRPQTASVSPICRPISGLKCRGRRRVAAATRPERSRAE